jgi:hypothetical protein
LRSADQFSTQRIHGNIFEPSQPKRPLLNCFHARPSAPLQAILGQVWQARLDIQDRAFRTMMIR